MAPAHLLSETYMLDALNMFQPSTAGQTVTATAVSTSVIPLTVARDIGRGEPVKIECIVTEAFTDSGSDTTVTVTIETDDDEAFGSALVAQTIGTFSALSAIGTKLEAYLQPGKINEKFMRLRYTIANGSLTTGKIASQIVDGFNKGNDYPIGNSIK